MPANFNRVDTDLGQIDLDTEYITDQWLFDRFYGSELFVTGLNQSYGTLGLGDLVDRSNLTTLGTGWVAYASGSYHAIALKNDGTLWGAGFNTYGAVGDGSSAHRSSLVQVGDNNIKANNWKNYTCAREASFAITTDNALYSWGYNVYGNLGDGTTVDRYSPKRVGLLNDWAQVDSSSYSVSAVKTDGTLWAWGDNAVGKLGFGAPGTHRSSPVQVGSLTNWKQVSTGAVHAAVKTDGTLWAWGDNSLYGSVGTGNLTNYSSPVQIGSLTNWKSVSVGDYNVLAVKTDGTLWGWGSNSGGQLGLGDVVHRSSPVQIGSLTNWKSAMTSYANFSVALKTDGTLWVWGAGSFGQINGGSTTSYSSPVQIGTNYIWRGIPSRSLNRNGFIAYT